MKKVHIAEFVLGVCSALYSVAVIIFGVIGIQHEDR